jgi:hypothetical protein
MLAYSFLFVDICIGFDGSGLGEANTTFMIHSANTTLISEQ